MRPADRALIHPAGFYAPDNGNIAGFFAWPRKTALYRRPKPA